MRYKNILLVLLAAVCWAGCQKSLTQYVNPMVGTDDHGHTFPGAIVPFGQIQPGPDTRLEGWDGCSGYHYSDDTLYGFSHTHLNGTGCEDFCDILLMPVMTTDVDWKFSPDMPQEEYRSFFSHRSEKAEPGYYRVVIDRNRVMAELTATERVACHRYTFPYSGKKAVVIDLRHRDKVIKAQFERKQNKNTITGWRESNAWNPDQKCFFAMECNVPIKEIRYFDNGMKALVILPNECKQAEFYVSISGVDCSGAIKNLHTRGELDFDKIRQTAHRTWESALGKIKVEGGSNRERKNFYTALYHCYTSPYLWNDIDGRYRGMDGAVYSLNDSTNRTHAKNVYTVFSLWDTYRTLHPLMTILEPEITKDFISTMLRQYETGGELTMWELAGHETHCMIGYHSVPVILEAEHAGLLDDWSPEMRLELLKAAVATSNRTEAHRAYAEQGYLDSWEDNESVSKTLEYAYDDWCIAQLAKKYNNDSTLRAIGCGWYCDSVFKTNIRRAQSWQNVMDENGFMHARRNGGFITPFDPTEVNNHYTEANSWQYSTYVPHDVPAWIDMLGGKERAMQKIDSLFNTSSKTTGREQSDITGMIGQYAHGNEPSHHAAYLYAYLGAGDKSDEMVHKILHKLYSPTADGLCGNEDCGQMSAWYVMSAIGLYPMCPGSGEYVTVTPIFDQVTIHREGQEDLVIRKGSWPAGKFWRHGEFFDSSISGIDEAYRVTPAPYFSDWQQRFEDSTAIRIAVAGQQKTATQIYYTTDGSTPDTNAHLYTQPIMVNRDITLKAVAYNSTTGYSHVVTHNMTRFIADKKLTYLTQPAPQYTENGPDGLIDRIHGTTNYRIGGWQGWQGDMEAVVDLLEEKVVYRVGVECLENMRSWIFFPSKVDISISTDGTHYYQWCQDTNNYYPSVRERQEETVMHTFGCSSNGLRARYIKIKASNYGKMPAWHVSAGEQAWLFIDEVEISSAPIYRPIAVTDSTTVQTTENPEAAPTETNENQ